MLKTRSAVRITQKLGRQDLDCDVSLQLCVTATINFTHSAFSQTSGDLKRSKSSPNLYRHKKWRGFQETAGVFMRTEQSVDFISKRRISGTFPFEEQLALAGLLF